MAKIFLDFDGPILDNRIKYYTLYRELSAQYAHDPLEMDAYWEKKKEKIPERQILSLIADEMDRYEKRRLELIEDISYLHLDALQPLIKEIFSEWSKEHELYLVTLRKKRESLLHQLDALGLTPFFVKIFNEQDNAGDWQVKVNLLKNEIARENAVIIGDTEVDILAGKELRIKTVALTCGIRSEAFLKNHQPDFIYDFMKSIPLNQVLSSAGSYV